MWEPATLPYCGAPPQPGALWGRWNLDPILLCALTLALLAYVFGSRHLAKAGRPISSARQAAFLTGWSVGALALISPLCPLSVSLFSARVAQHMILALVAAPMVQLGRPGRAAAALAPRLAQSLNQSPATRALRSPLASGLAFALALWFWHAPGPYDATFASPVIYWLMHLSVFAAALLVWTVLLDPRSDQVAQGLAVGGASTVQMSLLGAIITLTPHGLYSPHAITPYAWGLTQTQDQQIGGLIMWVPGCVVFLAATLINLGRAMADRAQPDAWA
jgi:putative membrane protein